jgi:competence protein ComEC
VQRAGIVLALGCTVIALPNVVHFPHGLEITHLDVGQADAAVIRTPHDHVILIDTGGELERPGATSNAERAGERIVLGYLRRAGIHAIDLMILTHPHGDHVGGCAPIIDALPVRILFDSGQTYDGRAYRDCLAAARTRGVRIVIARRGMQWTSDDGLTLDILAPSLPFLSDTGDDVNENSIVAILRCENLGELFMGDAGEVSEARLLAAGDDLRADVLKVGHHGSQYASTQSFIAAVHPHVAIISVGRHNTFGHPGPFTLATFERAGSAVYRTDRCGGLTIRQTVPLDVIPTLSRDSCTQLPALESTVHARTLSEKISLLPVAVIF